MEDSAVLFGSKAPSMTQTGSKEVKRKPKKKGEKRKQTFCLSSERDLKEKLEDMDTNVENEKKRKQSLAGNLNVSNAVILALKAPINANIEGSKEVRRKQKKKGEKRKDTFCLYSERDLKEKLEDMDTNIENKKKRKQSLDDNLNVSNSVILALKAPVNANIEGSKEVRRKQKKKGEKRKDTFCLYSERELKEKLEDMDTNIENKKKRKQSLDDNLNVSNAVILALKAPINAIIEPTLQTLGNNTEGGSCRKMKKEKSHKTVENNTLSKKIPKIGNLEKHDLKELEDMKINIETNKKRKHSFDENLEVSITDDLALAASVNGNIETAMRLQTTMNNIEGASAQTKKKKKCKAAENNSPVQKLLEVDSLGEQALKELEDMKIKTEKENRKQLVDENCEVSYSDDLALKTLVNGNIKTSLQTADKSMEEGSSREKKRKKKKHKAVENNSPVQKMLEVGSLGEQALKELEDMKIKTEKENRKQLVDENCEVSYSDDLALKTLVNGNIKTSLQTADKSMEEGSSREKKRKKKKHKAVENNSPVQKMLEVGSLGEQVREELEDMETNTVKERKRIKSVDENLDVSDIDYLSLKSPVNQSMETGLQAAENNTEWSSGRKNKRKKKKHKVVEHNSHVQRLLEDGNLGEQDVRELEDVKINTEKEKKRRHVLNDNMDVSNADDLSLKSVLNGNIKMALQTAEKSTGGSSSWKKKREEKKCKAVENTSFAQKMLGVNLCEQKGKELENVEINMDKEWMIKESLDENKVISKVDDIATKSPIRNIEMDMQTTENNAEGSSRQKNKRTKRKSKIVEINEPVQELLESSNLCDPDLKNIKHLEKANYEVSLGNTLILDVLESVDTDLKKNDKLAEISLLNTGRAKRRKRKKSSPSSTRKKLLILDLNGLLADIVSVAPKGFKADKRIAKKSLFKRTHCDEFLKFCFERFDVGVWSSRLKKNVDSVVDFLMKDFKHRLLFCWDQSHCTDTGFKTIENKDKPIVLKELKKLWDKHDPNLPWEKGEYNESNTLLVDDSPYKALCNPPNTAIFPYSYRFQDTEDNSLGTGGDLRIYLEGLSMAEDVQKYVKEHPFGQPAITSNNPSWSFYSQVVGAKISEVQL